VVEYEREIGWVVEMSLGCCVPRGLPRSWIDPFEKVELAMAQLGTKVESC
jgi:hypothetical protein